MRNEPEKALFITQESDFKQKYGRIYFGNEFCENLIPQSDILKRWYDFVLKRKKHFTFVTPYVTDFGLGKLEILLSFLNKQKQIEVVFNDWGVLKLIKDNFLNLSPVLGRLLTKQRRDPRMKKVFFSKQGIKEIFGPDRKRTVLIPRAAPQTLYQHYQSSLINTQPFHDFLINQGVKRLEIDNLLWNINLKLPRSLKATMYLPYGYVSTSRKCGKLTLTNRSCRKECQRYFLRVKDKLSGVNFYGIGNTVFYKTSVPPGEYLNRLGIDRIVYQSKLPF